jgi:DNA-binding NarL/FixJ family response regulator
MLCSGEGICATVPRHMSVIPIRLMLVDDHTVVRMGLIAMLHAEPDLRVVAEAGLAAEAIESHARHQPDVTLLDVRLPGSSGVDVLRALRKASPKARVIMLSTYQTEEEVHSAIKAGASGYLMKAVTQEQLVAAIRRVHSGGHCIPASVAAQLADRSSSATLTQREREVLGLLTRGLTNRDIAGVLGCAEFTVKTHLQHIFVKLDVADRTEATSAAIQRGLVVLD